VGGWKNEQWEREEREVLRGEKAWGGCRWEDKRKGRGRGGSGVSSRETRHFPQVFCDFEEIGR